MRFSLSLISLCALNTIGAEYLVNPAWKPLVAADKVTTLQTDIPEQARSIYHMLKKRYNDDAYIHSYTLFMHKTPGSPLQASIQHNATGLFPKDSIDPFCSIIAGTSQARIMLETPSALGLLKSRQSSSSTTDTHALVIPQRHIAEVHLLSEAAFVHLITTAARTAGLLGSPEQGLVA